MVVAANRDEVLDRSAEGPRRRAAGGFSTQPVLCPRDRKSGGTWLGVNASGLFVGITNRAGRSGDETRRSRGALVQAALGADTPAHAVDAIGQLRAADYNGFHLVLANADVLEVIWGDGQRFHRDEKGPGIHAFTERSYDAAPTERFGLIDRRTAGMAAAYPGRESLFDLLEDDGNEAGFEGIYVDTGGNYGTRSSTVIELGSTEPAFWYRGRRPATEATPWTDFGTELRAVLANS